MVILDSVYLTFVAGNSNKFYTLALLQDDVTPGNPGSVAFNYGAIGKPRGWGWKAQGVDAAAARKVYDKFLQERKRQK